MSKIHVHGLFHRASNRPASQRRVVSMPTGLKGTSIGAFAKCDGTISQTVLANWSETYRLDARTLRLDQKLE